MLGLLLRHRRQAGGQQSPRRRDALDTVADWPPEATRVLTIAERRAYDLLRNALPGYMILAQVPLARFLRVPTRHSYAEWLQRVGGLSADLLVCDGGSRVLAVIDVRAGRDRPSAAAAATTAWPACCKAAGIAVQVWSEDRAALGRPKCDRCWAACSSGRPAPAPAHGQGHAVAADAADPGGRDGRTADCTATPLRRTTIAHEPVPSTCFDDLEAGATRRRAPPT